MTDLIARIEAAQPSEARELFEEAATALWGECIHHTEYWQFVQKLDAEAYLDAAAMFVPEGWRPYSADMSVKGWTRLLIEGPKTRWSTDDAGEKCAGDDWYAQGTATTPYYALLSAAMKARQTDERD